MTYMPSDSNDQDLENGELNAREEDKRSDHNLGESSKTDGSTGVLPKAIMQTVFDRLNFRVQQASSEVTPNEQQELLEQLGYHLRQWRIKRGYTRQELADRVNVPIDQLLCIEGGVGLPADVAEAQLTTLSMLVAEDDGNQSLAAAIEQYLTALRR